ncbi:uncharacterized protein EV420DRAFT_1650848 [Desarmillaria tabescens]|uniref:Uncharacterized protein n=1 Tax=Armillaria tabescens TaxID=1929756 RepID=A0AA39MN29_ARMTA|nr:uncharacterized protein EV420DRAFT_1650848 [Desarmillaria tabescens]KAK0439490.1 hypothetical protein EV420DRAFT_1650848 [Desarmillaria tabescens]
MSMTTTIPSLSPEDLRIIFETTNTYLNITIMEASLFGIYTGVFCATMWNIFSSERSESGRGKQIMITIISCLFILEAVTFGTDWSFTHNAFIQNGWNFFTVFGALQGHSPTSFRMSLTINIDGGISTILADISMIWRCWTVWGRRWPMIVLPTLCSLAGTATKVFQTYHYVHDNTNNIADTNSYHIETMWTISYLSLSVATTMVCTILIMIRIFVAGRANHGGIQLYRGVIEILVESALLYSVTLLIYTVFIAINNPGGSYFDVIAPVARGIAPTLIVGRVAAGHARPNDSWTSSSASSLRFGASPGGQSQGTTDEEAGGQEGQCLAESFGGHLNGNCGTEEEAVSGHANEPSQTMAGIIQS